MSRAGGLPLLLLVLTTSAARGQTPTPFELAILDETNLARTSPAQYASYLERMLPWFTSDTLRYPGSSMGIITTEGADAVREAILFLRQQEPAPALAWADGLWRAARDHAQDQGRTAATGHVGADGSTHDKRIERYGRWLETAAENIEYGSATARDVVISLIVDDAVPNRGHRKNIFATTLRVMGAACGPHATYRQMCVIDYAGGFEALRDDLAHRGPGPPTPRSTALPRSSPPDRPSRSSR